MERRFSPSEGVQKGINFEREQQALSRGMAGMMAESFKEKGDLKVSAQLQRFKDLAEALIPSEKLKQLGNPSMLEQLMIIISTLIAITVSGCIAEWNDDDNKIVKPPKTDAGILDVAGGADIVSIIEDILDQLDKRADIKLDGEFYKDNQGLQDNPEDTPLDQGEPGDSLKPTDPANEPINDRGFEDREEGSTGTDLDGGIEDKPESPIDSTLDAAAHDSALDAAKDLASDATHDSNLDASDSLLARDHGDDTPPPDVQQAYLDGEIDIEYDTAQPRDQRGEQLHYDISIPDQGGVDALGPDRRPDRIIHRDRPEPDQYPDRPQDHVVPPADQPQDQMPIPADQFPDSPQDRPQIHLDWVYTGDFGEVDGHLGEVDAVLWTDRGDTASLPDSTLDQLWDYEIFGDLGGQEIGNDLQTIDWQGGIGDECDPPCLPYQICSYGNECVTGAGLNCDPINIEICNGEDDTCDGVIDPFCTNLEFELCDMVDNNGNGEIDEGCISCEGLPVGYEIPCGNGIGECQQGHQSCQANEFFSECFNSIAPTIEICDGKDNDCDGQTDEGCKNYPYSYEINPPEWWYSE